MTRTVVLLLAGLAGTSLFSYATPAVADESQAQKAVLITGATTGIGRLTAETLAVNGYFVYAGARKDADMEELNKIDNVMAVRLDVTKQEQIDAAVELIEKEGRGLWGLVNNAGVNQTGPMIEQPVSDIEFVFDVNVMGVVRVTQAFAPMVIESRGRIVNISSISGVLAMYGYGAYTMSKHAVEAYTDTLADEMWDFGVAVSAIEPGSYQSDIGKTRCTRLLGKADAEPYRFHEQFRQWRLQGCRDYLEFLAGGGESSSPEPTAVAAAIEHALFSDEPKQHYMVVPDPMQGNFTLQKLMEELLSMNYDHEYSLSREQLIEMMDAVRPYAEGEKSYYEEYRETQPMRDMFYGWMDTREDEAGN
jgi:NAD(P)-dependent dehydrogenase (short-subunit alcohol dehydrogenase family)